MLAHWSLRQKLNHVSLAQFIYVDVHAFQIFVCEKHIPKIQNITCRMKSQCFPT